MADDRKYMSLSEFRELERHMDARAAMLGQDQVDGVQLIGSKPSVSE